MTNNEPATPQNETPAVAESAPRADAPTDGGLDALLAEFDRSMSPSETPLPAALPLFATGLGALGRGKA